MEVGLGLSLIILAGFLAAKLFREVKIPAVTSYILIGVALGPFGLNVVPLGILDASAFISDVVLGLIAFHLGQSFSPERFRLVRRAVVRISALESLGACIAVTLSLAMLGTPPHVAFVYGSISMATAPASTMMVIEETRSRGPLTNTLLGVVALDGAWALITSAIALVVARTISLGRVTGMDLALEVGLAIAAILLSLLLGAALAWALHNYSIRVKDPSDLEMLTLGVILLTVGVASSLGLSVLLSSLALGMTLISISPEGYRFFDIMHPLDTPLYLIFFVLAGALLDLGALGAAGVVGLVYILARGIGKLLGSYLGGSICGQVGQDIRRYIGLALFPQAGVALGVALLALEQFPMAGGIIFSTIVATTVVLELLGPLATRAALEMAGEVTQG